TACSRWSSCWTTRIRSTTRASRTSSAAPGPQSAAALREVVAAAAACKRPGRMLERQTLRALYVAAEAGFQQEAGSEVARVDPLLRGAVRRRVQQAVDRGVDLTGPQTDALDEGHQL